MSWAQFIYGKQSSVHPKMKSGNPWATWTMGCLLIPTLKDPRPTCTCRPCETPLDRRSCPVKNCEVWHVFCLYRTSWPVVYFFHVSWFQLKWIVTHAMLTLVLNKIGLKLTNCRSPIAPIAKKIRGWRKKMQLAKLTCDWKTSMTKWKWSWRNSSSLS